MERLVEQDPGIGQLRRGEQSFFRMPGNLAPYRMRERAETDYRNAFKYAEAKGRAEGGLEILFSLVRDGLLSTADTRLPMTALSRFRVLNTGPTTKAEDKARAAGQGWS